MRALSLLAAILMALSLSACVVIKPAEDDMSSGSSSQSSVEESEEQENESSSGSEGLNVPVIAGSNAYDITVSLEDQGMPEAERSQVSDGYTFSSSNTQYSYTISTDTDYAVSAARFDVLGEDDGFLAFCATMPYDTSDAETISTWIKENIGSETSTVIGDAEFVLLVTSAGPSLEIKALGRDEYLEEKIFGAGSESESEPLSEDDGDIILFPSSSAK